MDLTKTVLAALILLSLALLAIPGCASNAQGGFRGNGSRYGNMTDAQRQQFMQARIDACAGKSDGDSCVMVSPYGNRTGNCMEMNSTLQCAFNRTGSGYPPTNGS